MRNAPRELGQLETERKPAACAGTYRAASTSYGTSTIECVHEKTRLPHRHARGARDPSMLVRRCRHRRPGADRGLQTTPVIVTSGSRISAKVPDLHLRVPSTRTPYREYTCMHALHTGSVSAGPPSLHAPSTWTAWVVAMYVVHTRQPRLRSSIFTPCRQDLRATAVRRIMDI